MFYCYGIPSNSTQVCSGNGKCIAPDTCACNAGTYESNCAMSFDVISQQILSEILMTLNLCPAGTYKVSNDSTTVSICVNCPTGTYNSFSGATSIAACVGCPAGTFSTVSGATSILICQTCPPGEFLCKLLFLTFRNLWEWW
jgi:hypothetical protein